MKQWGASVALGALMSLWSLFGGCSGRRRPGSAVLPYPDPPFKGSIGRTTEDSVSEFPQPVKAPKGAPNVLLIMTDDVGYGANGVQIHDPAS